MAYLFDETNEEFDNAAQRSFLQAPLCTEQTEHVDKVVVHGVVLGGQLGEEHTGQIGNFLVVVLQALGHLAKLTLDLDLTGQNEESQGHKTSSFDRGLVVIETAVQEVSVLVNEVVEADGHITEGDHGITAHNRVFGALHDCDQKREILLTVLCGHAHELCHA